MAKVYSVEEIKELLNHSDRAVIRGIVRIYERQTADEQNSESTRYNNGIGFSACDGQILTSFAKQIIRHSKEVNPRYPTPLSRKQLEIARRRIIRYARQLCEIANQPKEPVPT